MGIKEGALALADELEAFEDGDCEECIAYGQPECKGHLSCMEIMARYAARKVREAVERDAEDVTTVSAYDLLPDEDREAIAWVREMGGVNALSRGFQDADNRRIELCSSLGIDLETGWADAMVAMRRRLMPEGMEWPTVDGEPVDFKTSYEPSLGVLEAVSIYNNGACEVMSHDGIVKNATEIHVFKPKVVDADGVEIKQGDTVCGTRDMEPMRVVDTDSGECGFKKIKCEKKGDGFWFYCPDELTHKLPVLAADGEPLEVGQTVWHVGNGVEFTVIGLPNPGEYQAVKLRLDDGAFTGLDPDMLTHQRPVLDADGVPIREGDTLWRVNGDGPFTATEYKKPWMRVKSEDGHVVGYWPDDLTHAKPEPPDSWERIEEDATRMPGEYCERYGIDGDSFPQAEAMSCDLVRRARKLAEGGVR